MQQQQALSVWCNPPQSICCQQGATASLHSTFAFYLCRANRYGDEARSVSTADSQVDDVREDLDRHRTRANDKAYRAREGARDTYDDVAQRGRETYDEAKQQGRGVWGNIKDFFGQRHLTALHTAALATVQGSLMHASQHNVLLLSACKRLL